MGFTPWMGRIPDHVRQEVISWPSDAPRGAVEEFCTRHGVSRAWFYKLRRLAQEHGELAMEKLSTRPARSPTRTPDHLTETLLAMRRELKTQGKDFGAESVLYALSIQGVPGLPSRATVTRIFDRMHVVDRNKKKRPKSHYRRFAAAFANQRWQADAFEHRLSTGEQVTVIEIIDDATRFSLGLKVAAAETSAVVVELFAETIAVFGAPVRAHTDNSSAFNRSRYNTTTALESMLLDHGTRAMTGRPRSPRSQGKVERSHQTIQRFLEAHPCSSMEELQRLLVEEYQPWYNHQRAHQSLAPRTTPGQAYAASVKVAPASGPLNRPPLGASRALATKPEFREIMVSARGRFYHHQAEIYVGAAWAGQRIFLLTEEDTMKFFDSEGSQIAQLDAPFTNHSLSISKQVRRLTPPESSTKS